MMESNFYKNNLKTDPIFALDGSKDKIESKKKIKLRANELEKNRSVRNEELVAFFNNYSMKIFGETKKTSDNRFIFFKFED